MVTVGLCGGSGSGKGTLCRILSEMGVPSFDCDAVYHAMISADSEVTRELAALFGNEILSANGGIDRKSLAAVVFSPERRDALAKLNEVTHRHVKNACFAWLDAMRSEGRAVAVVDAPLLFEAGFDAFCDLTVAVVAPLECRLSRIMSRDGIERDAAERRLAAQISDGELIARADIAIDNSADEAALRLSAEELLQKIKEKTK